MQVQIKGSGYAHFLEGIIGDNSYDKISSPPPPPAAKTRVLVTEHTLWPSESVQSHALPEQRCQEMGHPLLRWVSERVEQGGGGQNGAK